MINQFFHSDIENKIIINIKNAKHSIKIAVAWFTNPNIFNLLLELNKTNIKIELILSDDKINFTNNKVNFQKSIDENIELRVSKFPKLMHNKFCIIDNKILINGSYNWTFKAEKVNFENIVISTDRKLVNDFNDYYDYLKKNTFKIDKIRNIEFQEYSSLNEQNIEIELIENNQSVKEIILNQPEEKIDTDAFFDQIEEANLLYLEAKHEDCITFCLNILKTNPQLAELYTIMAKSYWRLEKYKELIEYANKAIELNREDYEAYNLLGIGYSNKKGEEKKSIENYEICIKQFPDEDAYYRNRALSNIDLENETSLPLKFREKYKEKANKDLEKIIQIIDNKNQNELNYSNLYSKAFANNYLNKPKIAKLDIEKAIEKYNQETDKHLKDKNELIEMKKLLRDLKRIIH